MATRLHIHSHSLFYVALFATLIIAPSLVSAHPGFDEKSAANIIHDWNRVITNIQMYDGFSPSKATRNFGAANIAAYQAALPGFPACRSLAGQINGMREFPHPDMSLEYDWRIAAAAAYRFVAKDLLYADSPADSLMDLQVAQIRAEGVDNDVIERSKAWGETAAKAVKSWYATDGFTQIQGSGRYVIPKYFGAWEATPPGFNEPADPYWAAKMRPFTLERPNSIMADPPAPFDTARGSAFYAQAKAVYDVSRTMTDEQRTTALYWNDNPATLMTMGHTNYMVAWMTPPAHWISITAEASRQKGQGIMEALETYTMVSLAMYDSFLACWWEKFHSNVIRPITYIQRYMDSTWEPLIQTPPFPEHVSGHSSLSGAAATMLEGLFGKMKFTDSTSMEIGFEPRTYNTFVEAGREAMMSRLYGGIHYPISNEAGFKLGQKIAKHILSAVKTRS